MGVWSGDQKGTLLVTAEGLAYGLLSTTSDDEVVRGHLFGQGHQIQTSSWQAASLHDGAAARQVFLSGQFQPKTRIDLDLIPGDDKRIALDYDRGHDQSVPLSEQAGRFLATVFSEGFVGDYTLTLGSQGDIGLISQSRPNCQAHGQLIPSPTSAGLADLSLSFQGDPCMVPGGTVIQGLSIFDPAIRQLSAFGMNGDGGIGLFFAARP